VFIPKIRGEDRGSIKLLNLINGDRGRGFMLRKSRLDAPGALQQIIAKGIDRRQISRAFPLFKLNQQGRQQGH